MNTTATQTTSAPQTNKKWSWKTIATVVGLTLFFTGAMATVLIVQRQRVVEGPVAPTAPVSEPAAAGSTSSPASCALTFTIGTPTEGVSCVSKVAYPEFLSPKQLISTQASDLPTPITSAVPSSEFVYVVTIAGTATTENVFVTDVLPAHITFVGANPGDRQPISYDTATRTVTANLGKFAAAGTKRLQFKVKTAATFAQSAVNTASITLGNTAGAGTPLSCPAHTMSAVASGEISCTSKKAYTNFTTVKTDKGELIPAGGMITAGKEFVYAISVTATAATQKNATITDVLPVGVSYVGIEPSSKQPVSYDSATRTVTAKIGTFTANSLSRTIEFKVKTAADIAVGKFTNTAKVQFDGEAATTAKSCDATLEIPPQGTAGCEKRAITNFTSKGGVGVANSIVQPGNVFVYQIKVLADKQTTGTVKLIDTLPAGIEFMEDPDNTAGLILSADKKSISLDMGTLGTSTTNKTTIVEFKVKVASNATGTLVNSAAVTTGSTTPYKCEQSLVVQTVNSPAATPAPGCNDVCKTNADCSNSAHICYTTSNGTGRCRLDTNPTNESCSSPVAGTPNAPAAPNQPAVPTQPVLPDELPETGAEDWGTWLKAGLVTLGAGAILLLLL